VLNAHSLLHMKENLKSI